MPPPAPTDLHAPVDAPIEVIHLDEHLVVLAKPAGLSVTPERTAGDTPDKAPDTLTNRLWHHLITQSATGSAAPAAPAPPAPPVDAAAPAALPAHRPLIVHRLDRDVSGVIVYARTAAAHRHLSQQFEAHTVRKIYLGIVAGHLEPPAGDIHLPIGPLPKPNHRTRGRIFVNAPGAKAAHTRYRTREQLPAHSLVELQPTTGRRHQLRVHLAALEHPLVGDPLYGKQPFEAQWPAALTAAGHVPQVALHAERLRFRHPADEREVEYRAALPAVLQQLIDQLRTSDFPPPYLMNT